MTRFSIKHTVFLVVLSILWGGTFLFVKIADISLGPLTIMASRAIISTVFLFIILTLMGKSIFGYFRNGLYQLTCCLTSVLIAYMWLTIGYSEKTISAGMASILITGLVVFSWLISAFITREKPFYFINFLGIIIATFGIALMIGFHNIFHVNNNLWLSLLYLSGLAVFAGAASLNKRFIHGINPLVTVAFNLFYMAILLTICAFVFETPLLFHYTRENMGAILALSLFSTGIGYMLFFYLVNNAGLLFASLNGYLVPIFGFLMSFVIFHQSAKAHQFFGLLIVFIGMVLIQKNKPLSS